MECVYGILFWLERLEHLIFVLQTSQCPQCQHSALTIKQDTQPIPIEVRIIFKNFVIENIYTSWIITTVNFFMLRWANHLKPVGMDLIGKVAKTEAGNEYIAFMVDYFTKWSEAHPLPSKTAAEVAKCIIIFLPFWSTKANSDRPGKGICKWGLLNIITYCEKVLVMNGSYCLYLWQHFVTSTNSWTSTSVQGLTLRAACALPIVRRPMDW